MGDGLSRSWRARVPLILASGLCLLGGAGCERLPWASSKEPAASPGSTSSGGAGPVRPPVVRPDQVVAKVNDSLISTRDVELAIEELKAAVEATGQPWSQLAAQETDQYDLVDLLNDLVMAELRKQDALARGLDRETETQQLVAYRHRSFFAQSWVDWQLKRVTVGPEEIEQYYRQYQLGFREPEQIRVRQLVIDTEQQAKSALVMLLEGTEFMELARQISVQREAAESPLADQWVMRSAEKAAYGVPDEAARALVDPTLEQAAFAIDKPGGVSSYVKGPDGRFHIFQLIERRPPVQRSLVEVSDTIREFLRLRKLQELTDTLRAQAAVESFPERLKGVAQ